MEHIKSRPSQNDDSVSLVDIIQFLNLNKKFIGIVTLILSAIAIGFSFLSPKQYQKQITLSVRSTPTPVFAQSLSDVSLIDAFAVEFLTSLNLAQITAKPQYNPQTRKITLILESPNASFLDNLRPKIVNQLKTKFQQPLSQSLETSLNSNQLQLRRQQQLLPQLEQKIAQIPPTDTPKLEALEIERAKSVTMLTTLEIEKNYIEHSQKNLADFTNRVISVQIWNESEAQQTRSSLQLALINIIASFMLAVLAAVIRNQVVHLQDELSKKKIN